MWQLAMDAGVSLLLVLGHALVLMCQGMAFSVAMNSKRAPALIALVIASNFGEIKGVPGTLALKIVPPEARSSAALPSACREAQCCEGQHLVVGMAA